MEATTQIFLRVQVDDDESSVVRGEALVEGYADRMLIDGFSFSMRAKLQSPDPDDDTRTVMITGVGDRWADVDLGTLPGVLTATGAPA